MAWQHKNNLSKSKADKLNRYTETNYFDKRKAKAKGTLYRERNTEQEMKFQHSNAISRRKHQ